MQRRWNGWGDPGFDKPLPESARSYIESYLGAYQPPIDATLATACDAVPESGLSGWGGAVDTGAEARLRHAHGQSFADWAALRHGRVGPFPDAVARPGSQAEVRALIDGARERGAVVIPYGGGTSVVGHLAAGGDDRPVLSLDMGRMARLLNLDEDNRIARIEAGAPGPVVEAQLRAHGYVLGHYPQSFEYSTLGGWVVTRSAGQQSRRYGRIESLFHGGRLICPHTDFDVGGLPASAAGPDLREWVMGSEGRLGVLTEADVRIQPVPAYEAFHVVFFPDWAHALAGARRMTQSGADLSMLRVSNAVETDTQLRLAGHDSAIGWLRRYLGWRRLGGQPCMMVFGVTGARANARLARRQALACARRAGGVHVGRFMGRAWEKNRFAGAYLRNTLWDVGLGVDTVETVVPWDAASAAMQSMEQAVTDALADFDERALVFSHLSHVYDAGCSIYMTLVFRLSGDYDTDMARWRAAKTAASEAIVARGGSISHQHGVGLDHQPYLSAEKQKTGLRMIENAIDTLDPDGMMNPGKLVNTGLRDTQGDQRHVG